MNIKNRQKAKDVILWREEIEQLEKNIDTIKSSICFVENADCSEKGIAELVRNDESEFFFVADIHNNGMELRTDVLKLIIDEPVRLVQGFRSHTVVNGIQRSIGTGITNSVMTNTLENRLCHRALLTRSAVDGSLMFDAFAPVLLGKDSLISFVRNSFYVDARDCKLLDESIESLCQMLMKSETADHAGCMIREITAWLNAYDRPFSDLEEILDNAGYEYPKGLLQAYIVSTFNRRKENNRVVVKKASEFKYARKTLDQMLIDGTFYKVKQQYSTSSKKTSISSKIKKKMHKK